MAMNKEECLKIIDKEKETDAKLRIAHCMRFTDVVAYFKDLIDTGKIGSLVSLTQISCQPEPLQKEMEVSKEIAGRRSCFRFVSTLIDTIRHLANSDLEVVRLSKIPAEPKADEAIWYPHFAQIQK